MQSTFVNIQSAAATGAAAIGDWIKDFNDVFYLPLEFGVVPGYGCNFCNSIIESGYKLSDDLLKTYSYSIEEALIHCDYLRRSNFITHCHDPYTDDEIAVLKSKLRCVSKNFLKDCYYIHNNNSIFGKIKKDILYFHKRDIQKLMKKFFLNFCGIFSDKNIFVSMNFFNNHKTEFFIKYSHFFMDLK